MVGRPFEGLAGAFGAVLADPPWRFSNRTGKVAPEHQRLRRYHTMTLDEIAAMPVHELALPESHLYLWVPNALLQEGLHVMEAWGFAYKTNLVWYKVRRDGGPDGRGVGFYFRNVTELVLFGTRGGLRTLSPGRREVNLLASRKREHSRKPDELYEVIERCSPGPYVELFARRRRPGWVAWGDEVLDGRECPPARAAAHAAHRPRCVDPAQLDLPGLAPSPQVSVACCAAPAMQLAPGEDLSRLA